jgi:ATP adenylyltransferase
VRKDILLKPGTLRETLDERIRAALDCGALRSIETEQNLVEDSGIRFLVRMVSSLRRKEAEKQRRAVQDEDRNKPADPFLPPEPELTVADVSATHLAVLNKFNVLDRHLLIVTRRFEHQEALLNIDDFRALFACMTEYDGLGFYNGGVLAGASQIHKHLQLVPLPLAQDGPSVPIEPLLTGPGPHCPALPFEHSLRRLDSTVGHGFAEVAEQAMSSYSEMLADLGVGPTMGDRERRQSAPYNLLVTKDWMLAVPRAAEFFQNVSINALGFAGSLFVRDREGLDVVRREGPMRVLQVVVGKP